MPISTISNRLIEHLFDTVRLVGYKTGYPELDKKVRGLRKGSLLVIAAATGVGKSILSLNLLLNLASSGVKCVYIDLENGATETLERILRIKHALKLDFFLDEKNKARVPELASKISNLAYFSYEDLENLNYDYSDASAILRFMQRHKNLRTQVFLIDPLQAIEPAYLARSQSYFSAVGNIIKNLKEFAQKNQCLVILNHHVRKGQARSNVVDTLNDLKPPKVKVPTLEDLRGTGKISDYATDVWLVARQLQSEDIYDRSKLLVRIGKQRRHSNLGDVFLHFNEDTLQISDEKKDPLYRFTPEDPLPATFEDL